MNKPGRGGGGPVCSFFLQAEDGIRDYKVTGVQTCALPIYRRGGSKVALQRCLQLAQAGRLSVEQLDAVLLSDTEHLIRHERIGADDIHVRSVSAEGAYVGCVARLDCPVALAGQDRGIEVRLARVNSFETLPDGIY